MYLILKQSNKAIVRKSNKAIKLGQYYPCTLQEVWSASDLDTTNPYTLSKLQSCASAAATKSFTSSTDYASLSVAFTEDAPYFEVAYMWARMLAANVCLRYSVPSSILSRQYTALTLDFYDSGGTLSEYGGTSDYPVLAYGNDWANPNYPILFGVCVTTSRPSSAAAAGTPLFTVDMNQATAASVQGNAGITNDGTGYWPVFYDSNVPLTFKITNGSVLDSFEGYSNLYVTLKHNYLNQFYIPSNYSQVLHKQVSVLQHPYVYIYA